MPSYYRYAPQQIRDLPLNLQRSQMYPGNPATIDQAIMDSLEGRKPIALMPQKMLFTRYKNGPAAMEAGASAVSSAAAADIYALKVEGLTAPIEANKGIYTPQMASDVFVALPQPMDNWWANPNPVARNLMDKPVVQASELNAFAAINQGPGSPGWTYIDTLDAQPLVEDPMPFDSTPLGHVRTRGAKMKRAVKGLGKAGMGFGALSGHDGSYSPVAMSLYGLASLAGTGIGAYHGYKRNNSVGWAIGWALLGGIFPIIVIPVAYAQGIGKRKGR